MALPSEHASPQGKVTQYKKVSEVLPMMLVGYPPYEILDELVDEPNICCFKEDGTLEYAAETMRRYSDRWKFMTGGGLWRNYTQWPWSPAFFCFFSSFAPHVAKRYWNAYQERDASAANEIIREKTEALRERLRNRRKGEVAFFSFFSLLKTKGTF